MRYYIALGFELCRAIENKNFNTVKSLIEVNDGDIIAYNPTEDSFEELIESMVGWDSVIVLSSEELDEISKHVELDRPQFQIGEELLPIEKLTEFLNERSIKELISKKILVT